MTTPLPWELEQALGDLGLPAPRKERKKLEQPREIRDVSWFKRVEECPH